MESDYIYGIHASSAGDGWGGTGADLLDGKGWVIFTEGIGQNTNDISGRSYLSWSGAGLGVIVRLNHGYGDAGTIPFPAQYDRFAQRCANYVKASPGCHIWIIGNEPNHMNERPGGRPITPTEYADCYQQCRQKIKAVQPDAQVLLAAVAPWNWQTGCFAWYWQDVIVKTAAAGGFDGVALHSYTHGPDPSYIYDETPMNPPGEDYHWQFRVYRDLLEYVPPFVTVYITESDQEQAWKDANNGWVQNAYREIDDWNKVHPNKVIRCLALYRWTHDKWKFQDKSGVQADLKAAMAHGYRWRGEPVQPPPEQEEGMLQNPSFELPYVTHQGTVKVAQGWTPFYSFGDPPQEHGQGPCAMPEYKPLPRSLDARRVVEGDTAQCWFLSYKVMDAGIWQKISAEQGKEYKFDISAQAWCSNSNDPAVSNGEMYLSLGIDPTGGTNAWELGVVWTGWKPLDNQHRRFESMVAEAQSDHITLFIRTWNKWKMTHNDVYVDDARLTVIGEPEPEPPEPEPPEPTEPTGCNALTADEIRGLIREELDVTGDYLEQVIKDQLGRLTIKLE